MGVLDAAKAVRRRLVGAERVVTRADVTALGRAGSLRRPARLHLWALLLREAALGPPRETRVRIGDVRVELGDGRDFPVDWRVFVGILARAEYPAAYADASVLDVGAHKGYFGAYALACGAARVLSYEPATSNYGYLARAAEPFRDRWSTRQAAVGRARGRGTLQLGATSWGHSLIRVGEPSGDEPVDIVTLADAIAELAADGGRTIVKIDAEGSECDILSRPDGLEAVDVLLVEWHPHSAACSAEELVASVERAGLLLTSRTRNVLHFGRDR